MIMYINIKKFILKILNKLGCYLRKGNYLKEKKYIKLKFLYGSYVICFIKSNSKSFDYNLKVNKGDTEIIKIRDNTYIDTTYIDGYIKDNENSLLVITLNKGSDFELYQIIQFVKL